MSIDISKFHHVFFEDSLENIDTAEQALLNADLQHVDIETINTIFRCAHSIKGSSGMFGFTNITQFTHVMESYLEIVRNKEILLNQKSIDLLLKSLDCLRNMLTDKKNNKENKDSKHKEIEDEINLLIKAAENSELSDAEPTFQQKKMDQIWKIYFKPHLKIFQNGDDPLRIIRLLAELGEVQSEVDISGLQELDKFYPDECYLAWNILLDTNKNEEEIRQYAFEWVEDQSTIHFQAIDDKATSKSNNEKNQNILNINKNSDMQSVRVNLEKIDELVNIVGELVITQLMLAETFRNFDITKLENFKRGFSQLEQNCRELQEKVMSIRMIPIGNVFNRFNRMVRDLSQEYGKSIELKTSGETTELDKTLLEKIVDPLIHLVRNAIDHGIEVPQERKRCNKPETATLQLEAFHQGGNVIIRISDDGKGLNQEKIISKAKEKGLIEENENLTNDEINALIFYPGISTADKITDISGRGMGMDIVRKNIESLNGKITVSSISGKGTIFTIRLPLTLAIVDGQLVKIGDSIYIIPLISMIETIKIKKQSINRISNNIEVYNLRGNFIPIIRLYELFNLAHDFQDLENHFLVIVELNQQYYGIVVDELLQLHQVVIKNIENNYGQINGISGATVLGDGTVALILDVEGIIQSLEQTRSKTVA
ncbi:chemotaxis protein CheW [Candidatus Berkiella aquae]|uniref:Chemotaxis protein CheA n=1 Tax=Candidatus Berkiella aquae TaxID=295108 RepID=A0A0Q9YPI9_9GAMM|nr:chemotaxis protein CheA [Candidatus Berkiella aquae]MCS5712011.1 chemotaxis protein CheA [Candidatus Berkiella aquae]